MIASASKADTLLTLRVPIADASTHATDEPRAQTTPAGTIARATRDGWATGRAVSVSVAVAGSWFLVPIPGSGSMGSRSGVGARYSKVPGSWFWYHDFWIPILVPVWNHHVWFPVPGSGTMRSLSAATDCTQSDSICDRHAFCVHSLKMCFCQSGYAGDGYTCHGTGYCRLLC